MSRVNEAGYTTSLTGACMGLVKGFQNYFVSLKNYLLLSSTPAGPETEAVPASPSSPEPGRSMRFLSQVLYMGNYDTMLLTPWSRARVASILPPPIREPIREPKMDTVPTQDPTPLEPILPKSTKPRTPKGSPKAVRQYPPRTMVTRSMARANRV